MRIGEVAKRTGLGISNIRFYERKGLLEPDREGDGNYREYSDADIFRLKCILLYRKMGISIDSIYLLLNNKADLNEVLIRQKQDLDEQIANLHGAKRLCDEGIAQSSNLMILRHPHFCCHSTRCEQGGDHIVHN